MDLQRSRKAKSLQQALKDILKNSDPWDKDVEFQRKDLRKKYLCLLLVHPYAKESKDAEAHLWMQTSYNFISIYKQRLATLDRAIQAAKQQQQQQQPRTGGSGPVVEHRKLTQRFRQFLAEEEKFWTQLIVRHRREFDLVQVQPHLVALGIEELPAAEVQQEDTAAPEAGRRPSLFPPDDGPHPPSSNAERNSRLVIVSKALICLGDIARYRELYNDNRNKAGARRGRGGGPEPSQRPRNYDKAQQCYEKARILTPDIGNASHQLAILSAYQKDIFTSLTHYYRALCVRYPFEAASENFGTVLRRAYEQWRRSKREREKKHTRQGSSSVLPKVRVDNFKENIVLLHALWRLEPQRMDAEVPNHSQHVADEFMALVAERILPPDMISKVIVMSEGALWKHRMVRDTSGGKQRAPSTSASTITEHRIFLHILAVHRVLLDVGVVELAEPMQSDASEGDLAQRITAVFRRTLPALRIAGKWLKANYKYVIQNTENERAEEGGTTEIQAFWNAYARFFSALSRAFPMERLPAINALLEEDSDMKGFLPLRKTMGELPSSLRADPNKSSPTGNQTEEQVHPNVEQLMRIHDLLKDANAVVAMERCPVALLGSGFVLKGLESAQPPKPDPAKVTLALTPHLQTMDQIRDERLASDNVKSDDDVMTEATSRTEDDPVGDAFRTALDQDSDVDGADDLVDDDDEQIVWDPRLSPTSAGFPSPPIQQSPMTPVKAPMSPIGPPMTPTHRPTISAQLNSPPQALRTAQDLLNSFNISPRGRSNSHQATVSQPLLFGSGSLTNPGHSIWSPSMDDHVMNSASQNSVVYQSAPQQYHHAPSLSQSTWLSSQPMSSQHSQYNLPGPLPPNGFVPPLPPMLQNHQRLPSTTVPIGHELYPTAPPTLNHAYTNTIANSLANSQHSSQQYPVNITYRPVEGALYETPHAAGHPSIAGVNNFHTRHMSLVNDPRLGELHGASRPLPQPWGHIS
ncbi:hypothetical protein CCMSSC00406_0006166 [Pleurotus cornucopiae]|uniref:Uncharacterized protein n=1 Tax=Pleurotus cornucopiae TaxID=5321 RepID=A0ACB7J980_PLECO|nr:hypothetical protein CCMSSC00406_0006166 [Pleurotus cornucopiae]